MTREEHYKKALDILKVEREHMFQVLRTGGINTLDAMGGIQFFVAFVEAFDLQKMDEAFLSCIKTDCIIHKIEENAISFVSHAYLRHQNNYANMLKDKQKTYALCSMSINVNNDDLREFLDGVGESNNEPTEQQSSILDSIQAE